MDRVVPRIDGDERQTLVELLDYHRATVLLKVDGLDEAEARKSPVASGTSALGVVRHLAEIEHWMFRQCFAGEDVADLYTGGDPSRDDFHPAPGDTLADAVATYRAAVEASRAITDRARSLDDRSARPLRGAQRATLRWVLLHTIEETARHNGHLDLVRESIDGTVGE